jgi:hypothetical protein
MGNNVSVIPYAPIPEELKAKMKNAPSTRKKRSVLLVVCVSALCADPRTTIRPTLSRAKLTASSLGRTYGDENDGMPGIEPSEEEAAEAIDGTTFIKRFLRFKF